VARQSEGDQNQDFCFSNFCCLIKCSYHCCAVYGGASMATITEFTSPEFHWLNDPKGWNVNDETGETEGSKGDYVITSDRLVITPPAFKDFWSRTYYSPLLIKADASALTCTLSAEQECTFSIDFEFLACAQFDQVTVTHSLPSISHNTLITLLTLGWGSDLSRQLSLGQMWN
jgi:hypothetical protein